MVFAWYCTVKTFPERINQKGAPTIEISRDVFDSLNDFLLETNPIAGLPNTDARI